jgi:hypothetical protein
MDRQINYRFLLGISLFVIVNLACMLSNLVDNVRQGQEAIETIQGIATEFDESGVIATGEAIATQFDESGLQDTAQAIVTEISESGIQETAQSFATEIVVQPEDVPADIPIMDGEKDAFVGSDQVISYFISASFEDVKTFYETEMPANGWTKVESGTIVTDTTATLVYEKGGQEVMIVLGEVPFVGNVTVVINLP